MPCESRHLCALPNGMHARPASLLAETARRFRSRIQVVNESTGASADAASVLSVLGLDIKPGSSVLVRIDGQDAQPALAAIDALFDRNFGESAADVHSFTPDHPAAPLTRIPRPLRALNLRLINGKGISRGVGSGSLLILRASAIPPELAAARASAPGPERTAFDRALAQIRADLERRLAESHTPIAADLARAHLNILIDDALRDAVGQQINRGFAAPAAVLAAAREIGGRLRTCSSDYIRGRADDIDEIAAQLISRLAPGVLKSDAPLLSQPTILAAEALSVAQLSVLDRRHLRALVLNRVAETSHVALLARSLEIPTLIHIDAAHGALRDNQPAIADARAGILFLDPTPAAFAYYQREHSATPARRARLDPILRHPGRTTDGVLLDIAANAATPADVAAAMTSGADGVGLLRTELLFLDRAAPPTEDEQYAAYHDCLAAVLGRELIIRTLDIGGDKPAPYLSLPREDNPFLGLRGLRLYPRFPDLISSQLRALCRASAHGKLKIMAPMVSTVAEAQWFVDQVRAAQARLKAVGTPFDPHMPVGVMLEVPSACLIVDQLARVVDFFSIGTNDLAQYFSAADRTSPAPALAALNNTRNPAFLRLLDRTISAAVDAGKWIGVCGDMAADPLNLPLLVGLGAREISVPGPVIADLKPLLQALRVSDCKDLLDKSCSCESADDVARLLAARATAGGTGDPLLSETIIADCCAATKEDVIHELACAISAAARAPDPRAIEESVWAREDKYPTSLGFGFAIPHGRTDDVSCATIALARLRTPVDWGAPDGVPVRAAIMLAVRATDADQTHMRLLAKLARKLMHEDFRNTILEGGSPQAILSFLRAQLDL